MNNLHHQRCKLKSTLYCFTFLMYTFTNINFCHHCICIDICYIECKGPRDHFHSRIWVRCDDLCARGIAGKGCSLGIRAQRVQYILLTLQGGDIYSLVYQSIYRMYCARRKLRVARQSQCGFNHVRMAAAAANLISATIWSVSRAAKRINTRKIGCDMLLYVQSLLSHALQ